MYMCVFMEWAEDEQLVICMDWTGKNATWEGLITTRHCRDIPDELTVVLGYYSVKLSNY